MIVVNLDMIATRPIKPKTKAKIMILPFSEPYFNIKGIRREIMMDIATRLVAVEENKSFKSKEFLEIETVRDIRILRIATNKLVKMTDKYLA